jgi:hypothetical protein
MQHGYRKENKTVVRFLKGTDFSRDLSMNEKIILKLILMKYGMDIWICFKWLRTGTNGGFCEQENKNFEFHKKWEIS